MRRWFLESATPRFRLRLRVDLSVIVDVARAGTSAVIGTAITDQNTQAELKLTRGWQLEASEEARGAEAESADAEDSQQNRSSSAAR